MEKSKRLDPVLRVAESREDRAARELGEWQRQLGEHQRQLAQLRSYREDYQRDLQQRGRSGINVAQLRDTQRFLAQLDKAIAQQQQVVEQTARSCMQKRQLWQQMHRKNEALHKMADRYESEERHWQDRKDQKDTDEVAQRSGRDKDHD